MSFADLLPATWVAKIEAGGVAFILAASALGGLYLAGRHAGVAAEAPKVAAAQHAAAAAGAQSAVTTQAAAAADTAASKAVQITVRAEEAAHAVETVQGAQDALPPAVLAGWRDGIDGLRAGPAPAAAPGAGGGQPADAVPPAGG